MPEQQVRFNQREVRQVTVRRVLLEVLERHEVGGEALTQLRPVDHAGQRDLAVLDVDLPRLTQGLHAVEQRLRRVVLDPVPNRRVHRAPGRQRSAGGSRPERSVHVGLRRDLAEPVVEHPERTGESVEDRHLFSGVALHDLRVLLVGGLTALLPGEERDVVGDEPVHRGGSTLRGRIPRRRHRVGPREAFVLVQRPEELGVGVVVLLAGVRARRVHVRADKGRDLAGSVRRLVLGPLRNRVTQIPADDSLKGLAVLRARRGGPRRCPKSGSRR
jgi:hypothetical protein